MCNSRGCGLCLPAGFLLALGILGPACGEDPVQPLPPGPAPAVRVLFVGNSLTYFNDLPGLLAALADSAGEGPIGVGDVSVGGYGLEDHWIAARTRDAIRAGGCPRAVPAGHWGSPVGLPVRLRTRSGTTFDFDPAVALRVQAAAAEANRRHAREVPGWPPAAGALRSSGAAPPSNPWYLPAESIRFSCH